MIKTSRYGAHGLFKSRLAHMGVAIRRLRQPDQVHLSQRRLDTDPQAHRRLPCSWPTESRRRLHSCLQLRPSPPIIIPSTCLTDCRPQLHYPVLVQSIIGAGGIFVGTNPSYTSHELHHALKTSRARFVITEPELLQTIRKPAMQLGIADKNILLSSPERNMFGLLDGSARKTWRSLLKHGQAGWIAFDDLETAKNTTAMLLFSSGTTGLPKAAQLSHYNLIAQHTLLHENPEHSEKYHLTRMAALPLFHAAMVPDTHVSALRAGYTTYIMRRFVLTEFLDSVERFSVTHFWLVPPLVKAIVGLAESSPEARSKVEHQLRSVRHVSVGAAPLDQEMQGRLQVLLPESCPFTQLWGMTETSCVITYFYHPDFDRTGAVGRPVPNLDIKVIDDSDVEVAPGSAGELCVRGPTVIRGYFDNPEANSRDWDADGYFHTGDIGLRDEQTGLWYIVDRKKELLKVRGFQVAPTELEAVLLSHPEVQDTAVIGVVDAVSGELPRAYVVRKVGGKVSEDDVRSWVQDRLAKYKWLEGGVRFVDEIPKSATGKILKRVLRESAKKEVAAKL